MPMVDRAMLFQRSFGGQAEIAFLLKFAQDSRSNVSACCLRSLKTPGQFQNITGTGSGHSQNTTGTGSGQVRDTLRTLPGQVRDIIGTSFGCIVKNLTRRQC